MTFSFGFGDDDAEPEGTAVRTNESRQAAAGQTVATLAQEHALQDMVGKTTQYDLTYLGSWTSSHSCNHRLILVVPE